MKINIKDIFKKFKNSVWYKIYIEWLYFKIMIFFLFSVFFVNDPFLFLSFWTLSLLLNWIVKENIHFIKSISIFIWLYVYLVNVSIKNTIFIIPSQNTTLTILFLIFIVPLIVYIFSKKKELWKI